MNLREKFIENLKEMKERVECKDEWTFDNEEVSFFTNKLRNKTFESTEEKVKNVLKDYLIENKESILKEKQSYEKVIENIINDASSLNGFDLWTDKNYILHDNMEYERLFKEDLFSEKMNDDFNDLFPSEKEKNYNEKSDIIYFSALRNLMQESFGDIEKVKVDNFDKIIEEKFKNDKKEIKNEFLKAINNSIEFCEKNKTDEFDELLIDKEIDFIEKKSKMSFKEECENFVFNAAEECGFLVDKDNNIILEEFVSNLLLYKDDEKNAFLDVKSFVDGNFGTREGKENEDKEFLELVETDCEDYGFNLDNLDYINKRTKFIFENGLYNYAYKMSDDDLDKIVTKDDIDKFIGVEKKVEIEKAKNNDKVR